MAQVSYSRIFTSVSVDFPSPGFRKRNLGHFQGFRQHITPERNEAFLTISFLTKCLNFCLLHKWWVNCSDIKFCILSCSITYDIHYGSLELTNLFFFSRKLISYNKALVSRLLFWFVVLKHFSVCVLNSLSYPQPFRKKKKKSVKC